MEASQVNKNEVLILTDHSGLEWNTLIRKEGYLYYEALKPLNIIGRALRKGWFLLFKDLKIELWLGDWTEAIDNCHTIIVFANKLLLTLIQWLSKQFPDKRIIIWYWDPYHACKLNLRGCDKIECWSFDRKDCEIYGFKYNTTFYLKELSDYNTTSEEDLDVFFVGQDKGRYEYLRRLESELNSRSIKTKFIITAPCWSKLEPRKMLRRIRYTYNKSITYQDVLGYVKKSKSIADIYQTGQTGLSLRPMEMIYFEKKLITNNPDIKKYDFYHKENIFILDEDNLDNIQDFLNSPYVKLEDEIIDKYTFNNWFNRFFDDGAENIHKMSD